MPPPKPTRRRAPSRPDGAPPSTLAFHDVRSDDGTHLRAWTNDADGRLAAAGAPTVVLCNGLGTNPLMWPALLEPDCGVRVVSWYHRGVGGSDRPRERDHVEIQHFVEDALSVLDHFGVGRAVHLGWSMGVNTMFELAVRHPERVTGLFAVCGVPGDTFATMLGPLHLPHVVVRVLMVGFARTARLNGWGISQVLRRLPVGPRTVHALTHSGFMFPVPDPVNAGRAIREFISTPAGWYAHLALSTSRHARVSLSSIHVPAVFVGARYDVLAGARDMATAADVMDDARYVELRGSHFIQLERPDEVHALLLDFVRQVEGSDATPSSDADAEGRDA